MVQHHRRFVAALLSIAIILSTCAPGIHAHESCCKEKLRMLQSQQQGEGEEQPQFIIHPDDSVPPSIDSEGRPRMIADPSDSKPDIWDDEDDGEWEPMMILNPEYDWTARMIANPNYVPPVLPPTLLDKFTSELRGATPWLVLGVFVAAFISVLFSNPFDLFLGENDNNRNGTSSIMYGALAGLLSPLCSCGALPVAASMADAGIPLPTVAAFLTASQSSGVDSAFITWGLLGPTAAICRLVGAVVLAVAAGSAVSSIIAVGSSSSKNLTPKQQKNKTLSNSKDRQNLIPSIWNATVNAASESFPAVFVGLALGTLAIHYTPSLQSVYDSLVTHTTALSSSSSSSEWIISLLGPFLVRAAVLILALPLQLCEHTTATLAAALRKGGASPGLSFAFLMSAPATNLPTLLLLLSMTNNGSGSDNGKGTATAKKWKRLASIRVAMALSLTSLILSYIIDIADIDMLVEKEAEGGGGGSMDLPSWFVMLSPIVAGILSIAASFRAIHKWLQYCFSNERKQNGSCCSDVNERDTSGSSSSCSNTTSTPSSSCGKKDN